MQVLSCRTKRAARLLSIASVGAMAVCYCAPAAAQTAAATYSFDIPAQSLENALLQFNKATGLQLVYSAALTQGLSSPGVHGTMSADEALVRILSGTGLTFRRLGSGSITIEAVSSDSGERVLGAVRVQGSQDAGSTLPGSSPVNGINGSRDVTATEGTGSYTSNALTAGSKTAASIKDTSMAVSVLTSQRLQDQNITDLNTAMRNLPGVTVYNQGSTTDLGFYSRGFRITQFQFDGGAPMNINPGGAGYKPVIDLSLYDHIELVRGATGTFNAYGDPGGVVNLVRKKPLDHTQFLLDMQIGSWDWHRISVDVTGPLAFDGKLRGRFIATHQDNEFFYRIANANKNLLSGTLEYDVTPTTLLSVGFNYQKSHELPFTNGLMRYQNGDPLGVPRSTCLCFNFAKSDTENNEFFGQIEQKLGQRWIAKLKFTKVKQDATTYTPSLGGSLNPDYAVDPANAIGVVADPAAPYYLHDRQTMVEATLEGSFRFLGHDQKIVFGANHTMEDPAGTGVRLGFDPVTRQRVNFTGNAPAGNNVNPLFFNTNDWGEPNFDSLPKKYQILTVEGSYKYNNIYANIELTPFKRLHLTTGLRYSQYEKKTLQKRICDSFYSMFGLCGTDQIGQEVYLTNFGPAIGNLYKGHAFSWPPSVQWRYDITDRLTGSAVYTDIYVDQSQYVDKSGNPMPPITGKNFESSLKWLSPNSKLNANLSVYYIKKVGADLTDPICQGDSPDPICTNQSTQTTGVLNLQKYCCYVFSPDQQNMSYGADFEISGEIRKGWQISFSYNFNYTKYKNATDFDGRPIPLLSFAPRHRMNLWTSYNFEDGSRFKGLYLAFGAQAQSETYQVGNYCKEFILDPNSDQHTCAPDANIPYAFTDPGHVVFSGAVGYKLNDTLRLDVQLENLLDKTYYDQVGSIYGGNWYGAPRSFKLSLHGKW
ncbi:TonB-dependent receptor [Sphingomonas sp.]|uniref:TonB-dependent siderophore receptor n=1 Tax=Sphingomonas sp. TaxID=28214 RepID=UPI0025D8AF1C|nr:TonB-dependent receptor [Sphingomonas sp.]